MQITGDIRNLLEGDGEPLDIEGATRLWGAILDGAVDDLEVGAVVAALAVRGETLEELAGLHRALDARIAHWSPAAAVPAVAIPAYGLFPGEAAWVALAASLLCRFGMPVIVHGVLDSPCGPSSARVLGALDAWPCASLTQAEDELQARGLAFVPVQLLSAPFAGLLALRARLGVENAAHQVAQAIDPARRHATRITFGVEGSRCERFDAFAAEVEGHSLALAWPAGRSPGNLSVRPRIERIHDGVRELLFEADAPDPRAAIAGFEDDAQGLARWIHRVASGAAPVPVPALNLVAACVYATGQATDFSQAKAIAAIQAGRLAA